jgi:hypothetical protein
MFTGIFGKAGLAKEDVAGTFKAPTKFVRFIPPFQLSRDIDLIISQGVSGNANVVTKVAQGAALLKSGKLNIEVEPEGGIGEHLMAAFGVDTASESVANFVVTLNANDTIDFIEDGGSLVTAVLTPGTYKMGADSSVAGSLCKLIKDQMESANGTAATYTVTYAYATKKLTITKNSGVFILKWATGTNTAKVAKTLLGFTNADTASAIAAVSDSTTGSFIMSHVFSRVASAALPTYSWWQKNGLNYPQFAGCMLNKLEFGIKAKEFVMASCDWAGLKYVAAGVDEAGNPSPKAPFKFSQAALTVAGVPNVNYDELKIVFDNQVDPLHVIGNGVDASKIYSKGFKVSISGSFIVEDSTEWDKFIAGTSSSFGIAITGAEMAGGTTPFSLAMDLPEIYYQAAPLPIGKDLLKIAFTAVAQLNVAQAYAGKVTLVNSEAAY